LHLARGLDKEHKTKSIKDPTGVWYEEFNEISFNDFLKTTTSLRGGRIQEIATFNPEMETEWVNTYFFPVKESYEKENGNFHTVKSIRNDTTILHTTYRDNNFVTPQSAELLESFSNVDENYYKIYTLGLWGGVLEGLIYENWEVVEEKPPEMKLLGYGIDWGFTNDPTTIIKVEKGGGIIYLEELTYKKGMSNQDIIHELIRHGVKRNDEIIADSAEPKSIHEIFKAGFNIHPSIKGPDSIRVGISKVKEYKLKVSVKSQNLIRELKNYRWKMDKNGDSLNVPIDNFNHGLDAVRYVIINKTTIRKRRMVGIRGVRL